MDSKEKKVKLKQMFVLGLLYYISRIEVKVALLWYKGDIGRA